MLSTINPNKEKTHVVIIAGELSGDQHAASLIEALKQKEVNFSFHGMGMSAMEAADVELIEDATDTAVVGLFEVIRYFPKINRKLNNLKRFLVEHPPHLLILVDYPQFNLTLAKTAHRLGIKILFYISPKVWAWRRGRVNRIAYLVDAIAVIFPFEEAIYQQVNLPVRYVGNPLVDEAYAHGILPRKAHSRASGKTPKRILLLPGSRISEISRILPVLCQSAKRLQQSQLDVCFSLLLAPNIDRDWVNSYIQTAALQCPLETDTHAAMQQADFAIAASGTATLQLAIHTCPMVVTYKTNWLSYAIAIRLSLIEHFSLPNILAKKCIVPEIIQDAATAEAISNTVLSIIQSPEKMETMRRDLATITDLLGPDGTSKRLANFVCEMI